MSRFLSIGNWPNHFYAFSQLRL
ncbi:hypothetical protein HJC23_010648, partial [Cyclotella cryptica]